MVISKMNVHKRTLLKKHNNLYFTPMLHINTVLKLYLKLSNCILERKEHLNDINITVSGIVILAVYVLFLFVVCLNKNVI